MPYQKHQEVSLVHNKIKKWFTENSVVILVLALGIIGFFLSGQPLSFVLDELVARVARNSFLVLALIIPIIAGMGLNFGIVMGAMAGQVGLIMVTDWGIVGIPGLLLAILISTPFAILFGWLTGKLLNKTKGQEMITGMIAGYFSNGIYQLVFLALVGPIIPMMTKQLLVSNGIGLKNTIDLQNGVKYALDGIYKTSLYNVCYYLSIIFIVVAVVMVFIKWKKNKEWNKKYILMGVVAIVGHFCLQIRSVFEVLDFASVPVVTMLAVGLLCLFNVFILRTKLGQDFKTVGRNIRVANAAGINVDKVRIKAILISTVLAAWGQIIFIQNIGTINTDRKSVV